MTLQAQIDSLRRQIQDLEIQQARCPHDWGDIEYTPTVTEAYSARSWHGPGPLRSHPMVSVPRQERPRWRRVCATCGLVEHTERTKEVQRRGTVPGTTASEKVPTFSD